MADAENERKLLVLEYVRLRLGRKEGDADRLREIEKILGMKPEEILDAAARLLVR